MRKQIPRLLAAFVALFMASGAYAGVPSKIVNYTISGTTQSAVNINNTGQLNAPFGLLAVHELIIPPLTSSITYQNVLIDTTTLVNGSSTTVSNATDVQLLAQPGYPMALTFTLREATGTFATSVYTGLSTVTVRGIDSMGYRRTETILVSTTLVTSLYAFATISNINVGQCATWASSETSKVYFNVGGSSTIGLANDISTMVYTAAPSALYASSVTTLGNYYPFGNLPSYAPTSQLDFPAGSLSNSGVSGANYTGSISTWGIPAAVSPIYKVSENGVSISSMTINPSFGTVNLFRTTSNGTTRYDIWYNVIRSRKPIY